MYDYLGHNFFVIEPILMGLGSLELDGELYLGILFFAIISVNFFTKMRINKS